LYHIPFAMAAVVFIHFVTDKRLITYRSIISTARRIA
jgi:hypothetical protein